MTNRKVRATSRFVAAVTLCLGLLLAIAGCGQPPTGRGTVNALASTADQPLTLTTSKHPTARTAHGSSAVSVPPVPPVPATDRRVPLGPGFTNNFNHALVRTAQDRLYIAISNDNPARVGTGRGYVSMLRATTPGRAAGFEEQDTPHRPVSGGAASAIIDASIAIDGQGVIHVLYQDRDGDGQGHPQLKYTTFSTLTDTWGAAETVEPVMSNYERGYGGTAISLDSAGVPHITYANQRQVFYRNRSDGEWSAATQVSDSPNEAQHPSIAHGPENRLHIAWHLRDPGNEIRYRSRAADGQFDPSSQLIAGYQRDTLNDVDQGPALTLTADGTVWCAYLDGNEYTRVRRLAGAAWVDDGPGQDIYSHAPTIAAVNNDLWLLLGHDDQVAYAAVHKPAGAPWGSKQTLEAGKFDGSANARWSWFFNGTAPILDTLFFDEGEGSQLLATIFYRAIDTGGALPPTATPIPPTSTPEPTATPVPPTATPVPSPDPSPSPSPRPTPCAGLQTPVLDTFDRADGALSGQWQGETHGYQIGGGQLIARGDGAIVYGAAYGPDQEVFATFVAIPAQAEELDLLLKVQNGHWSNGALEVLYNPVRADVQVWSYAPATSWVQHGAAIPLRLEHGAQLGARAVEQQVEIYHNGALLATQTIVGWPFSAQGGAIGLWSVNARGAVYDDFGGGSRQPLTSAQPTRAAGQHRVFTPVVANRPCGGAQP